MQGFLGMWAGQMMKQHGTRVVKRWASFVWRRSQIYYTPSWSIGHGWAGHADNLVKILLPKLLIFFFG